MADQPYLAIIAIVIIVEQVAEKAFEPLKKISFPPWLAQTLRVLSPYVVWVLAAVAVWFTEIDLFSQTIVDPYAGRVMTAIVAGGGSSLLQTLEQGFFRLTKGHEDD